MKVQTVHVASDNLLVKTVGMETRSITDFPLTKMLVTGELVLVNEHQLHLPIVTPYSNHSELISR